MSTTTTSTTSLEDLKSNVLERLAQSGEYEKMVILLKEKLLNSGWYSDVNDLVTDQLSKIETPNFEAVSKKVENKALNMVPQDIKMELLTYIKKYLEQAVEQA